VAGLEAWHIVSRWRKPPANDVSALWPEEAADLGPACWFMVSRRALAPVAAYGEATKPGLASAQRLTKSAVS